MKTRRDPDEIFKATIAELESGARDPFNDVNQDYYLDFTQSYFADYVNAAGIFPENQGLVNVSKSFFMVNTPITVFLSTYPELTIRSVGIRTTRTTKNFLYRDVSGYGEIPQFKEYVQDMINARSS